MITYIHNEEKQINNITYVWFIGDCLSTDFKPVDHIYDGSKLFEKDTLKQYVYNASKGEWEATVSDSVSTTTSQTPSAESNNGILLVSTDYIAIATNNYVFTPRLDKIASEILNAFENGVVFLKATVAYDDIPEEMYDEANNEDYLVSILIPMITVQRNGGVYWFSFCNIQNMSTLTFIAETEDDYPVYYPNIAPGETPIK